MQGCSKQAKARAYTALVRPHLETCSLVWTPYQRGALDDLEKVQNSAARWICAQWDNANYCWTKTYEECCYELNWATVHQRHLLLTCYQAYKIVNNMDSLGFEDYFPCSWGSTYYRPGPFVQPLLSEIKLFQFNVESSFTAWKSDCSVN